MGQRVKKDDWVSKQLQPVSILTETVQLLYSRKKTPFDAKWLIFSLCLFIYLHQCMIYSWLLLSFSSLLGKKSIKSRGNIDPNPVIGGLIWIRIQRWFWSESIFHLSMDEMLDVYVPSFHSLAGSLGRYCLYSVFFFRWNILKKLNILCLWKLGGPNSTAKLYCICLSEL